MTRGRRRQKFAPESDRPDLADMDKRGRYGLRLPDNVALEWWEAVPLV